MSLLDTGIDISSSFCYIRELSCIKIIDSNMSLLFSNYFECLIMIVPFEFQDGEKFEIPMDNDMQEMSYYSIGTGDTLLVRW